MSEYWKLTDLFRWIERDGEQVLQIRFDDVKKKRNFWGMVTSEEREIRWFDVPAAATHDKNNEYLVVLRDGHRLTTMALGFSIEDKVLRFFDKDGYVLVLSMDTVSGFQRVLNVP